MNVLTLILAGGQGSRLSILGEKRAKPAVPFAGKYRIIDFPLSNAVNSGLYRVAILTQYRPHSLMQHVGIGEPWDLNRSQPNGVQIWQPYQGRKDQDWYRGTADALYQNRNLIAESGCDRVLVLSGDHIYKQDYRDLLGFHEKKGADLTVAVMHVQPEQVHRFGIMDADADQRITRFTEKPKHSESTLASMGIYVFNTRFLLRRLEQDAANRESSHDFGKNIIPKMVEHDKVFAYPFSGLVCRCPAARRSAGMNQPATTSSDRHSERRTRMARIAIHGFGRIGRSLMKVALKDNLFTVETSFSCPRTWPCGITQMIAMRYGCLPLVPDVGGLSNTVHAMQTGFVY